MKVFLSHTPEINSTVIKDTCELLSSVPGELTFTVLDPISKSHFKRYNENNHSETENPLKFEYFFELINEYRTIKGEELVSPNDFFILFTSINNTQKFASAFNEKNIFIRTISWEKYTNRKIEFSLAQQVAENIFHSLLGVNVKEIKNDPNIHLFPTGCISDLCKNKYQFILKIRSAYICDNCIDSYLETSNKINILIHIQHILTQIREKFSNYDRIKNKIDNYKISISNYSELKIGDKIINLKPIPKTLYILLLQNPNGIQLNKFDSDEIKNKMNKIYDDLVFDSKENSLEKIRISITKKDNYFRKTKNIINQELENTLGIDISEQYKIISVGTKLQISKIIDQDIFH